MMRFLIATFMALFAVTAFASKDKGTYFGGGFNIVNVGIEDPFSRVVNFKTFETISGYKHNNYLGIEVRYGFSLNDENIAIESEDSRVGSSALSRIDDYYSVYYRAELTNEIAKVYLLLGQSRVATRVGFGLGRPEFTAKDRGLSYGVGFGLWLDERMNLNFEFRTLIDAEGDSFTAGGINADYRF